MKKRKTPIMGWSSWNEYQTHISEETITAQIDCIKKYGLDKLGYEYVNIDDGWFRTRDDNGDVVVDQKKFPRGMKYIADYAHQNGIKAGIYSDAGSVTCASSSGNNDQGVNTEVGLYKHEEQDLRRYFIDWGYDFIKIDWCGGVRLGLDRRTQYTKIGKIINEIEKEIDKDLVYNICCWHFPGDWAGQVADSWRTSGDIRDAFPSIMHQINIASPLAQYTAPGRVNDLDMMQLGRGMTYTEDCTHFAMWCMMSSPILLAMDLRKISKKTLNLISNEELIALDQDVACLSARRVKKVIGYSVFVKDLGKVNSNKKAVCIVNTSILPKTFKFSDKGGRQVITPKLINFSKLNSVRDILAHKDKNGVYFSVTIPPHGCAVYVVEGKAVAVDYKAIDKKTYVEEIAENNVRALRIGAVDKLIKYSKALVIDVRTPFEYSLGHVPGSINIPNGQIAESIEKLCPDKSATYITYCSCGKRSYQAQLTMKDLGYDKVYRY